MQARRRHSIAGAALVAAVTAALAVTSGVTAPATADNSGRRLCLYGMHTASGGGSGTDTQSETDFAVADYKRNNARDCPQTPQATFLRTLGRASDAASYQWWEKGYKKLTCEHFLVSADYLEGIVPDDFPAKDVSSFCDNTDDDILYNFHKSVTVDDAGQRHVTTTATNTKVKIGDNCNHKDPESRCWGFLISQTQAVLPRGVTVEVWFRSTPPGNGGPGETKEVFHAGPRFFEQVEASKIVFSGEYLNEPGWTYTMHLRIHPSNGDTLEADYDATKYQCFKISKPSGAYWTGDSSSGCTLD